MKPDPKIQITIRQLLYPVPGIAPHGIAPNVSSESQVVDTESWVYYTGAGGSGMRLYVDLNCFNRPFDNQAQERVHRETAAVFNILNRVLEGHDSLIWSWVLSFENSRHPKPDRRDEIALWQSRAEMVVPVNTKIQRWSQQLEVQGIPALDAAHLASAEAGGADVFLTCDDVIIRRARRLGLGLRVMNPVAYWKEVSAHG